MSDTSFPVQARRRRLGTRLRELRQEQNLTQVTLAALAGTSSTTLSRLENATTRPNIDDATHVIDALGVGAPLRDELLALARRASDHQGLQGVDGVALAGRYRAWMDLDDAAAGICEFGLSHIPALLHTRAYTATVATCSQTASASEVRAAVEACATRQRVLSRERPPTYRAVLDEPVVTRPVGGKQVFGEQLAHLAAMAQRPAIAVRVLPENTVAGGNLPRCSFTLYRFADPLDPQTVVIATETGDIHVDRADDVDRYRQVFDRLWQAARPIRTTTAHGEGGTRGE